jgi:hypothetical protein
VSPQTPQIRVDASAGPAVRARTPPPVAPVSLPRGGKEQRDACRIEQEARTAVRARQGER